MTVALAVGFIPLLDAAPLIVAVEFGFADEEGLKLDLQRAASWSMLRDMLDFAQVDAAQMLSVVPVARALGLGGGTTPLETPMVLTLNGQALGISAALRSSFGSGGRSGFRDAAAGAAAWRSHKGPIRIGVPFPLSMHTELLHYWLGGADLPPQIAIRTVPTPQMAEALLADEIDAFCVGEPWGSHAVEMAGAELLLAGSAIWSQAPEKVLAMRAGWAEENPDAAGRLMRALWRAGRWLSEPGNLIATAEILSRPEYLDVSSDLIERALTGRIVTSPQGNEVAVEQFISFHEGAANFPWRSQAAWIGAQLARRHGLDPDDAMARARSTFRSDLFRLHLGPEGVSLPRASEKAEGLLLASEAVPAVHGSLILARNRFFDGQIFDPGIRS